MTLLSAEKMAELIGCSIKTFRKTVREQQLPFYQFGRLKRFNPDEILAVTKTQETAKTQETKKKKSSIQPGEWTEEDKKFASEIGLKL